MRWQQFLRPETSMCIQFFWVMLNNLLMIKTWAVLQVRLLNSIACLFNMSENNCMPCLTKCFVILLNIKWKHFFCSSLLSCHFFLTFPFQGLQKLTLSSCVFYPSTDDLCQVPSWLNLSVSESEEYVWNTSFLQLLKKKKEQKPSPGQPPILVLKSRAPFGQQQESRPLQVQYGKSAIHGHPVVLRMLSVKSDKSDWLKIRLPLYCGSFSLPRDKDNVGSGNEIG